MEWLWLFMQIFPDVTYYDSTILEKKIYNI